MHCARLFEIANVPRTAIFSVFSKAQYVEVRKICIDAILHTDMSNHFGMVKEVQMLYEMHSDTFDDVNPSDPAYPSEALAELFRLPDTKRLLRNMILHTGDISNPLKPFAICHHWAWKVLDE